MGKFVLESERVDSYRVRHKDGGRFLSKPAASKAEFDLLTCIYWSQYKKVDEQKTIPG